MPDFDELLDRGRESRDLEYRGPGSWDELRVKITKTALAMANLRDGGYVIVGVAQGERGSPPGTFSLAGLSPEQLRTFREDDIRDFINSFADPHIDVEVHGIERSGLVFIVIAFSEFQLVPIVARKAADGDIRRGAIYTRTRKPETIQVPDASHMRETLDLATEKAVDGRLNEYRNLGLLPSQPGLTAMEDEYARERRGL